MIDSGGTAIVSSGGVFDVHSGAIVSGTLDNFGTVNVSSGATLTLHGTIDNTGTIETLSSGTVVVSGTVTNGGTLYASGSGSLVEIASGAVVNGGIVEVGNGIVDIVASGKETVSFQSVGSGGLEIADHAGDATAYSGKISGFGGVSHANSGQYIDLVNVTSGASVSFSYASGAGNTSGTLTVSSGGTVVATIDLVGTYSSGNFHIKSGAGNTVEITDPAVPNGGEVHSANIALFGSYIASFAGGGHGGLVIAGTGLTEQPLLVHPHA